MTRIVLEEPRAAGYPVVKRTMIGQVFKGSVLRAESRDRLKRADDGTMIPIVKPNGKHAQELVVVCLTLPGTTAPVGLGDMEEVPEPGDMVRLILKGKSFGDWIDAKRALPGGSLGVGDVVTQTTESAQVYDAQGNPSGAEITAQADVAAARAKGRSVGIYGPLTLTPPADGDEWLAKAVTAYRSLLAAEPESAAPFVPGGQVIPPDDPWGIDGGGRGDGPVRPATITAQAWEAMDGPTRASVSNALAKPPF